MGPGGYGGQRFAHDPGAPSTSHKVHGAAIYGNMDPINVPQMLAYIPAPWIQIISSKKWPPPFPETSGTSCGPGPGREIRWLAPPMVWFAKESKGMN